MNELARANGVVLLLWGLSQRRGDFQWVTSGCAASPSENSEDSDPELGAMYLGKAGSISRASARVLKLFP
jgi:hypothetical protein